VRELTVLYDPQCGLCCRVHAWLSNQPKYVELAFVPVASEEARLRYPTLNHALTLKDVTVISDDGAVYWGAKAWLMCLWALRNYREWSFRLSSPDLLPTTRRVVSMISQNRRRLDGVGKVLLRDSR
jgi:predicted DCC family thiol-disulfide oxidoreductase YuxK